MPADARRMHAAAHRAHRTTQPNVQRAGRAVALWFSPRPAARYTLRGTGSFVSRLSGSRHWRTGTLMRHVR